MEQICRQATERHGGPQEPSGHIDTLHIDTAWGNGTG